MNDSDPFGSVSTMRLYGGAVAVVSGGYSLWLSAVEMGMTRSSFWPMLLVGVVALVHGLALFTPVARSIGRASGPLMVAYAVVMLLLQAWMAATAPMVDGTMGGHGASDMTAMDMGADPGMLALALLMLFSGVVMTLRRGMLE